MGQAAIVHGGSISNLFYDPSIEKIAVSAWKKIWGQFMTFGNISAGLFGIFVIIRGIKLILDTILHSYALHSIYGCSCYLIGSLWDSLTQLLLLLGGKKTTNHEGTSIELQDVVKPRDPVDASSPPVTTEPPPSTTYRQLQFALPQEEQ